ncbi:DDE_3 domain-containing protein [Trichonephila clavipes]|nr:DDE_3 domain-containing protein [Trichonephila clavipes]
MRENGPLGQENTFPGPDSDGILYSLQTSPDSHWRAIQDVCSSGENEASDITVEKHSYRGGGIMVWAWISLGGHTDLHLFQGGTLTGVRYRDKILDPYVRPMSVQLAMTSL